MSLKDEREETGKWFLYSKTIMGGLAIFVAAIFQTLPPPPAPIPDILVDIMTIPAAILGLLAVWRGRQDAQGSVYIFPRNKKITRVSAQ